MWIQYVGLLMDSDAIVCTLTIYSLCLITVCFSVESGIFLFCQRDMYSGGTVRVCFRKQLKLLDGQYAGHLCLMCHCCTSIIDKAFFVNIASSFMQNCYFYTVATDIVYVVFGWINMLINDSK